MDNKPKGLVSDQVKKFIAMGAAMGAGCLTCSDKLYQMARAMKIPEEEMLQVFQLGLEAKEKAVETMRDKIFSLFPDNNARPASFTSEFQEKLTSLVRISSFCAANSAPDVKAEIRKAQKIGIPSDLIQMCISIAAMVRKNAQGFSDQEVFDSIGSSGSGEAKESCPCGCHS